MSHVLRSTLAAAALALLAVGPLAQQADRDAVAIPAPVPERQAEIQDVMHAATAADQGAALDVLKARQAVDEATLIAQLFLYSTAADSTRDAMALAVLRKRLELTDDAIVAALVPFYEAEDEELYREAGRTLAEFEVSPDSQGGGRPSLSVYRSRLAAVHSASGQIPQGLARHLFERSPLQAFRMILGVEEREPQEAGDLQQTVTRIEAVVAQGRSGLGVEERRDAIAELTSLAKHPDWWVRAYAGAVMARHAFLADRGLRARLLSDEHPLVRRLAGAPAEPR